jgi:broad specificity phosphatase PhoE
MSSTSQFIAVRDQQQPVRTYDLIKHPAQGETTIFLVRHGQTAANLDHRLAGITDVPLDPLGETQATEVAEYFRNVPFDTLLSSPLARARETARRIGTVTGHTPEPVPGLEEMHFGDCENLTLAEAIVQFPELKKMEDDLEDLDLAWPRGDSRRGFHQRVNATFLGILERYVQQSVVVVAHGGVIGSFVAQVEGGNPSQYARYSVANCSVTQLRVTPEATEIHCWNQVSHLKSVDIAPFELKIKQG